MCLSDAVIIAAAAGPCRGTRATASAPPIRSTTRASRMRWWTGRPRRVRFGEAPAAATATGSMVRRLASLRAAAVGVRLRERGRVAARLGVPAGRHSPAASVALRAEATRDGCCGCRHQQSWWCDGGGTPFSECGHYIQQGFCFEASWGRRKPEFGCSEGRQNGDRGPRRGAGWWGRGERWWRGRWGFGETRSPAEHVEQSTCSAQTHSQHGSSRRCEMQVFGWSCR